MELQPFDRWYRRGGEMGFVDGGRGCLPWRVAVALIAVLTVPGCGTEVDDLHRLRKDLELELGPFANTAEELAQGLGDVWALHQDLQADVLQRPLADFNSSQQAMYSISAAWRRGRVMALDVETQIFAALGAVEAEAFALTTQVRWARALSELYMGMTFCKLLVDETLMTDVALLREAELSLGQTIESAQRSGETHYLNAAVAARAQARMLLDDWAGAESDAMAVPAGFSYNSYSTADDRNNVETAIDYGFVGFLHKWWPLIEETEDPEFMADPWSGEPDLRIPAHYDGGTMRESETPHYRPLKYDSSEDDVPIVHYDMAQLIIAEAKAVNGDFAGATAVLNGLRAAVGLPPRDTPSTAEDMEELILWERFAELHLEGQRLIDLHRKGLMEEVFEELNDPERPGVGRRSKWGDCEGA